MVDLAETALVAFGVLCLALLLALTGVTTHRSNIERQEHDRDVKIACIQSGDFTAADCDEIVDYSHSD